MRGKVDRLTLNGSASSRAELGELTATDARVTLSNSALATVLASESLIYDLSSSSRLESLGDPAVCRGKVDSGARFIRVP